MIREIELNLFVPSSELLVRLASGERPLGVKAGPPRIRVLRETYFDTPDQALRRRGMTCKLRQGEGEEPSVVVTVGEGPDSEGITSRSRLTASAVGLGVFETLRGDSEPAEQIRKYVDPRELKPLIALDIQRLGRAFRTRILRRPALLLFFDRITVQAGRSSSVFHEIRVRRRLRGGPLIQHIGSALRDQYHLFPDGLSTLQRAHRVLAMESRSAETELSPYALSLALALFHRGSLGLVQRGETLCIPTFRGSGEDAARALLADLTGRDDLELVRLGTTDPREGRPAMEVWASSDRYLGGESTSRIPLTWYPWHSLLDRMGQGSLCDPNLLPALLLLTRRRLLGNMRWIPARDSDSGPEETSPPTDVADGAPELQTLHGFLELLRVAEDRNSSLEARIDATGALSRGVDGFFLNDIRGAKERILSEESVTDGPSPLQFLDLLSLKLRAITDRLYEVVKEDLLPALEERNVHLRGWSGIMREDRRTLLQIFSEQYLGSMKLVADWGPALVPEMPPLGCGVGLAARSKGSESTRFFHLVLGPTVPSFMRVPGSTVVLPLEEVIRGYLFHRYPELERAETHLFRFRTAEVTVRETVPNPDAQATLDLPPEAGPSRPGGGEPAPAAGTPVGPEPPPDQSLVPPPPPPPPTVVLESLQSVVVRVQVHPDMPEAFQTRLLRALERQASRKSPLIGWSDLYPVSGPMDLSALPGLLDLK